MFKIILSFNNVMFVIKTLKNINTFDYSFINKNTARKICKKLEFTFVFLSKLKYFVCFNNCIIKPVTYTIYFTFTVENYSKFICFMFIISINNHFLIFDKF